MSNNSIKEAMGLVKNPLGVIGLFLVLVEAIASFVIIKTSLNDTLNFILVFFIVLFPIIVLRVFYLLVTKHHTKLYSPSDFKDETNFVKAYNSMTKSEELVQKRLVDENRNVDFKPSTGMSEKDLHFLKDTLNEVVSMQKNMVKAMEEKGSMTLVETTEKELNDRLMSYLNEKKCKVSISPLKGCSKLINELRTHGYEATVYTRPFIENEEFSSDYHEHAAIWLGRHVPAKMAIEVIKISRIFFPELKYIDLSGKDNAPEYTHYQIYIGGATESALKRRLRPLTDKDFEHIYKMYQEDELHNFVNSFVEY